MSVSVSFTAFNFVVPASLAVWNFVAIPVLSKVKISCLAKVLFKMFLFLSETFIPILEFYSNSAKTWVFNTFLTAAMDLRNQTASGVHIKNQTWAQVSDYSHFHSELSKTSAWTNFLQGIWVLSKHDNTRSLIRFPRRTSETCAQLFKSLLLSLNRSSRKHWKRNLISGTTENPSFWSSKTSVIIQTVTSPEFQTH